jgi:hypothetical protein
MERFDLLLKEIELSKKLVKEFIAANKDSYKGYLAFIQRVLLTRQYITTNAGRFVPLPSFWLDKNNANGFTGTREWFEQLQSVRSSVPSHKIELKAFAEAILEMSEERTCRNYQYWRNYFIERKTPGLLNLFLNTIANQHYKLSV